jgi:hypothetical protein
MLKLVIGTMKKKNKVTNSFQVMSLWVKYVKRIYNAGHIHTFLNFFTLNFKPLGGFLLNVI